MFWARSKEMELAQKNDHRHVARTALCSTHRGRLRTRNNKRRREPHLFQRVQQEAQVMLKGSPVSAGHCGSAWGDTQAAYALSHMGLCGKVRMRMSVPVSCVCI